MVCGIPKLANRLLQVGVLSSIASSPLSSATRACAVSLSVCEFIWVCSILPFRLTEPTGISSCDHRTALFVCRLTVGEHRFLGMPLGHRRRGRRIAEVRRPLPVPDHEHILQVLAT